MADVKLSRKENAIGKYFVDSTCISCEACWKIAPEHFISHKLETYAFVHRQPANRDEELLCLAAIKSCPVHAIGKK